VSVSIVPVRTCLYVLCLCVLYSLVRTLFDTSHEYSVSTACTCVLSVPVFSVRVSFVRALTGYV
jgi:ABC-type transport system involved in cytochrome c biogenesis permease component